MKLLSRTSKLKGIVEIPGSKSHTIRAVAIASLAEGKSTIDSPLESADAQSAVSTYRRLGANIEMSPGKWEITGRGGKIIAPSKEIDVGNSGTTLRIAVGSAALMNAGRASFTGDHQIRSRPIGPLLKSLAELGAKAQSVNSNNCAPLWVEGQLKGGRTQIEAVTSQYLTSLLINCPLAENDTHIEVTLLNEAPYIAITLDWLRRGGIQVNHDDSLRWFDIKGGQHYQPFHVRVPGDFSSATFFLAAGALPGNDVTLRGLDLNDVQGDKAVIQYLRNMGANISITDDGISVAGGELQGCELDLNATPDALPMMAVLACFASGTTRLVNVPQARLKETDRIAVMAAELAKLGATIRERQDGLEIEHSRLTHADVDGHYDHRIVMALAIAGSGLDSGELVINTAEAVKVTYPRFVESLQHIGGNVRFEQ